MIFDSANIDQLLANGGLTTVILHEMAHVFGFGTIWDEKGLLVGACPTSSTPSFIGPSSQQGFMAALRAGWGVQRPDHRRSKARVPATTALVTGTGANRCMGNELMTGFLNGTAPTR